MYALNVEHQRRGLHSMMRTPEKLLVEGCLQLGSSLDWWPVLVELEPCLFMVFNDSSYCCIQIYGSFVLLSKLICLVYMTLNSQVCLWYSLSQEFYSWSLCVLFNGVNLKMICFK
jgi:hypothetical protein